MEKVNGQESISIGIFSRDQTEAVVVNKKWSVCGNDQLDLISNSPDTF